MPIQLTITFSTPKGFSDARTGRAVTVKDALEKAINICLDYGDYHVEADEWSKIDLTLERLP